MRILFDHGTPAPLRSLLDEHDIDLARERGWETLTNGDLLDLAESEGYDVLISTDKGIPYQQNLEGRTLTIVVVPANWKLVRQLVDAIRDAVTDSRPGACIAVAYQWAISGRKSSPQGSPPPP